MQNSYTSADHLLSEFSFSQASSINTKLAFISAVQKFVNLPITTLSPGYTTTLLYYLPATIPIYCYAHPLRLYLCAGGFPLTTDFSQTFLAHANDFYHIPSVYYSINIRILCGSDAHYDA